MEKTYIRNNRLQNNDKFIDIPPYSNKIRKNKLNYRTNIAKNNPLLIRLDKFELPSVNTDSSVDSISLHKDLLNTKYGEIKIKNTFIERRQLKNFGEQGTTAFIVEIVGISVAVIGILILIAACVLYPKRRKRKNPEKSVPLYENSTLKSQDDFHSRLEYEGDHSEYNSVYPKESIASFSTQSFPAQPAPVVTHKKSYKVGDIPINSRDKHSDSNRQNFTNSVIMDTDNYTHSAMKLFSPFNTAAASKTSIIKNNTFNKGSKEQYQSSLKPSIFEIKTPKLHNRESTVDPYSSTDSVTISGKTDSVFSGYGWTQKDGHVIPPRYYS